MWLPWLIALIGSHGMSVFGFVPSPALFHSTFLQQQQQVTTTATTTKKKNWFQRKEEEYVCNKLNSVLFNSQTNFPMGIMPQDGDLREMKENMDLIDGLIEPFEPLMPIYMVGQAQLETLMTTSTTPTTSTAATNTEMNRRVMAVRSTPCLVLSQQQQQNDDGKRRSQQLLLIPVTSRQLKLMAYTYQNKLQSKSTLISNLNPLLVNRDGALFDNLPWDTWSKTGNKITQSTTPNVGTRDYNFAKRKAFNKLMMGKNWDNNKKKKEVQNNEDEQNNNTTTTTTATATTDDSNWDKAMENIKYTFFLQRQQERKMALETNNNNTTTMTKKSLLTNIQAQELARHVLTLRLKDLQKQVSALDEARQMLESYTSNKTTGGSAISNALEELGTRQDDIFQNVLKYQTFLVQLLREEEEDEIMTTKAEEPSPWILNLLDELLLSGNDIVTENNDNDGAATTDLLMLQAMTTSNKEPPKEGRVKTRSGYASPFDVLLDILDEEMNASVIGAILEMKSLVPDNEEDGSGINNVGGAIILRRNAPKGSSSSQQKNADAASSILGRPQDGNIFEGETILVECDIDEAIGIALAAGIPLQMEPELFRTGEIVVGKRKQQDEQKRSGSTFSKGGALEQFPLWKPPLQQQELQELQKSFGKQINEAFTKQAPPPQKAIPLTPFVGMVNDQQQQQEQSSSSSSKTLFPTDNPIQSLSFYDSLSLFDKARILKSLSNFEGTLPRPRVLRNFYRVRNLNEINLDIAGEDPLDKLLLPLIDEGVRRQYRTRRALDAGKTKEAEELQLQKSKRQDALERARRARILAERYKGGQDGQRLLQLAEEYEREANMYDSLRADVTQDEGSYDSNLDRDEWYQANLQSLRDNNTRTN